MGLYFKPEDDYYLSIDLGVLDENVFLGDSKEFVNCILLSIPYAKFDRNRVGFDYDVYFNFAMKLAEKCDFRAYDKQLNQYMDTKEFQTSL